MKTTRLFSKTLLIMVVLFGLVANATALLSGWMLHKHLSREYRAKAVATARGIAAFSQDIAPWDDASALRLLLQRFSDTTGLSYLLVSDRGGRILAQAIASDIPPALSALLRRDAAETTPQQPLEPGEPHVTALADYIDVRLALPAGREGFVHAGIDRLAIRQSILSIFFQIQLVTLAIFLASIVAAYLLVRGISRPLRQLTDYARRLAARDFTARIEIKSKDEVGMLAATMSAMSRELDEHISGMQARVETATSQSRQTLRYLEAVLGNLADGLLVLDPQGRVARANPACQVIFRRPFREIMGAHCRDLLGLSLEEITARAGSAVRLELNLHQPNGMELGLEVAVSRVELDRQPSAICILRDVSEHRLLDAELARARNELEERVEERTAALERANRRLLKEVAERTQAEENLRRSQERFRSLSDSAPDIVFTLAPDGTITYVNPAWTRLMGHGSDQVLGRPLTDFVAAAETAQCRDDLRLVMDQGRILRDITRLLIHRDGGARVFNHSAAPYLDSGGALLGVVGMFKDVTEHRQLEAQLRHAQKMEAVGTLAGGVAHEFNNILMTIKGYTQLMAMHRVGDDSLTDYLARVDLACRRAADLTGKMLTFSRLDLGEKGLLQLGPVLQGLRQLLRQTLPPSISLKVFLSPEEAWTRANPAQLEQVILNLVLNARDAMPQGGTVSMGVDSPRLGPGEAAQAGLPAGDYHRITVTDDGPGMTPEVAGRIFEPFFTTKEPGKGTGLGLSVAYTIVDGHGGRLAATSRPGQGTTFSVLLPALPPPAQLPYAVPPPEELPVGRGERLLVVDDEPELRQVVRLTLEAAGYEVETAEHGGRALEMFLLAREQGRPFGLVILDLAMPVMDGNQCLRRLLRIDPETRIIMATGHPGDHRDGQALQEQARAVLLKPFDLRSLLTTVSRVLAA